LDNAVKYSSAGGTIDIRLYRKRKNIFLEVYNECGRLDMKNIDRLFDRFYRADSSRSDKKGYGIGLSIAKAIAETRGYKISVQSDDGYCIRFTLEL
jgi:signal transduction histidine kinase